jgi:hypothetical protein
MSIEVEDVKGKLISKFYKRKSANKRLVRTSGTRRNFGIIARYTRAVALYAVYFRSGRPQCRTTEALGLFCVHNGWSGRAIVFEHQEGCPARNVWTLLSVCCGACAASWRRWFTTGVPGPSLPVRVRCRCRASRVPAQRQRDDVSSSFRAWGAWHHVPPASWPSASVPARRCVSHNGASGNVRAVGGRHAIPALRNSGFRHSLSRQTPQRRGENT